MLAEDATRLQKIDELYALRLDQYVSLPQLVVVGDQSSGKSSVLEGLTNLPFPRDSGLCTRFPTQIVFKRSSTARREVSIMAVHGQDQSRAEAIAKFGKKQLTSFDEEAFSNLLAQASDCMGLPYPGNQREENMESFSHNILKFELWGPEYENFSVVDLPGLFRKPTPGQTSREDMGLVREIVAQHLSNPRSIILAVVPANVDIATQEIIQMAEDVDPDGQRTLGVLTKPDLVDQGAEKKVIELVMNQSGDARFELGYTIVCNRSQNNLGISHDERNARESRFFDREPWNVIPAARAGVQSLKARLNTLLVDVTRHNFQAVAEDVRSKIRKLEQELHDMGPGRHTASDQRNHLIRIATDVREIASRAIDAYYGRDSCFEDDTFRLATNVMTMNESFSDNLERKGYTRKFRAQSPVPKDIPKADLTPILPPDSPPLSSAEKPTLTVSSPERSARNELLFEYPELQTLIQPNNPVFDKPKGDIMKWITKQYVRFKGFEIGTLNPSLLPALFLEQSQKWKIFANQHVEDVVKAIHLFNHKTLQHCCKDTALSKRLWTRLSQLLLPKYKKALDQVNFLIEVETQGNLITMNHYFADNLTKAREDRITKQLLNHQSWTTSDKQPLLRVEDTIKTFLSNEGQTTQDLHDTLEAYYKVARKRFVDAICLQAVDHFLISSKEGPLWLFSPQFIGKLTDAELSKIAGESPQTVARRSRLTEEIANLREGQKILEE